MKRISLLLAALLLACSLQAQLPSSPSWDEINQRGYPQWFSDAKLGIFIHWGLYSVPAYASAEGYGEWFYRGLMTGDEDRKQMMQYYGPESKMETPIWWPDSLKSALRQYAGLRDHWHAELWNPDQWAELFKASGARYVLLVTKHHDGYCLWDAKGQPLQNWNSVVSGPKRNIVGELTDAVRRQGMKMGFYYSLTEWTNPMHTWMMSDDRQIGPYVEQYMKPQMKALIEQYRPSLLFTDGEWNNTAEEFGARELIGWYYNLVPDGVVNDRWGGGQQHGFRTPEYSGGIMDTTRPWAECRGLGRSFGLNRNERPENYLSSEELIQHFVKLVAAGGGMTLNVGPNADGTIPLIQQERLRDLGHWLQVNGEAIYETRPYEKGPFLYGDPLQIERTDSVIDFDWVRNAPIKGMTYDHFNVEWEGDIEPPYSEKFTFEVEVDDNLLLMLDGDTLIDYRKDAPTGSASNAQEAHNYHSTSATVKLKAGERHHLSIQYQEEEMEARAKVMWSSKHTPLQPVPAVEGYKGLYSCMLPSVCYTRKGDILYAITLFTPAPSVVLHNLPDDFNVHRYSAHLLCFPDKECPMRQVGPHDAEVILPAYDTRKLLEAIYDAPGAWAIKLEKR